MGADRPLPPLSPELDPDAFIDDGPTPTEEPPPDMGPPRPEDSYFRSLAEAAADRALKLQQLLAEVSAERDQIAEKLAIAEQRCGVLAQELARLRAGKK